MKHFRHSICSWLLTWEIQNNTLTTPDMQIKRPVSQNCSCYMAVLAIASIAAISVLVYKSQTRKKIRRVVAEAGYETAHDIHFPIKINRRRKI